MIIESPKITAYPGLRGLWKEAFGDTDAFFDAFFETGFSPDRCRCVMVDDIPVAALYWFDCVLDGEPVAYLYAVATAKSHRGRGLCRTLMEDTHRHLREQGYRAAVLVPGSRELFDFYGKMDYQIGGYLDEIRCPAGEEATQIQQINRETYARLRREFLPPRAVVQEGENLAFWETQAAFYRGDHFLLSARMEGDTLVGQELLGNRDAAPAIVRSLGADRGVFRTPGTTIPFAMVRDLTERNTPVPFHFGLAFD